ncbi:MAG: aminotransferase class V-fold PLP-dependent enzyme, partial [Clostridia bacterium]|nr:aminotransferase class V-fold PLP-dependent enzyme [Clostridia bacterium]
MIFFDNASTTKICDDSLAAMNYYASEKFFNPSALYKESLNVSNEINEARNVILNAMGALTGDKFVFTSGATEANNTIIRSCARNKNLKMLFSMGEHPSVYNVALDLQSQGYNVQFINLNRQGTLDLKDLERKLDSDTCFVSFMHVSNETGAINDVKKITAFIKSKSRALVHCDGVQAFMKLNVNVTSLGIDFYTISAHKFHGPKGVGGYFVKNGINVKPFIIGGGQEQNLRSGTENVPAIIGMAKAVEYMAPSIKSNYEKIVQLSDYLCGEVNKFGYALTLDQKSPYINVLSFEGVRAETLLHMIEDNGYLVGNGSACS